MDPSWFISVTTFIAALCIPLFFSFSLLWFFYCRRPHLFPRPKRGSLIERFRRERDLMFIPLLDKYGSTCELESTLVTADPVLAGLLLTTKEHVVKRSRWYTFFSKTFLPGLHGILNLEGEEWKHHTEALAPLFQTSNVAMYGQTMEQITKRHVLHWEKGITAENGKLLASASASSSSLVVASSVIRTIGGGPSLLDAVRGIGTEIFLSWALGLDYELDLDDKDDDEDEENNNTEKKKKKKEEVREFSSLLVHDLARYGNLIGTMAQKPLMLVRIMYDLHQCTKDLRSHVRYLATKINDMEAEEKEEVGNTQPVKKKKMNKRMNRSTVVSRMLASGFSIEDIAAEINHIHGAHKAATHVLTHVLHDLCQPPFPSLPPHQHKSSSSSSFVVSLAEVGGAWWRERLREEWSEVLTIGASNSDNDRNTSGIVYSSSSSSSSSSPPQQRPPTRQDLSKATGALPLTQAVLEEAERLHPVSLGVVRQTGLPLHIDNVVIPAGTETVILLAGLQTHPSLWIRPHEFHPQRWLSQEALQKILERAERMKSSNNNVIMSTDDKGKDRIYDIGGQKISLVAGPPISSSAITTTFTTTASTSANDNTATSISSRNALTETQFLSHPPNLGISASLAAPNAPRCPPPFAHIPFLRGGRLCAGKELARLELAVLLHGILSRVNLRTNVRYIGHIYGVPVSVGARIGSGGSLAALDKEEEDVPSHMVTVADYTGPTTLRSADDMYARIDGDVPFIVERFRE